MQPTITRELKKLEASKAAMLQGLQAWPEDWLARKPDVQQWSAAQVLDHIARVEKGILRTARRNAAAPHTVTANDRVGSWIVRCVMRSPLRVKSPAEVPELLPAETPTYQAAIGEWSAVRQLWIDFLNETDLPRMSGVFAHPRGGWFSLPQTLMFLRLHHDHHKPQLRRIAAAIRRQA